MEGDISNIQFRTPGFDGRRQEAALCGKQASAILEMRLYKLIGLEIRHWQNEYKETLQKIKEYQKILGSREAMDEVIKEDPQLIEGRASAGTPDEDRGWTRGRHDEVAESARPRVRAGQVWLLQDSGNRRFTSGNRETVDTENVYVLPCHNDG